MSELLERFLSRAGDDRVAIHDGVGTHTHADVVRRALDVAEALLNQGSASLGGERVAILVHPSADFVATLYGVLLAGGCALVLSPLHPLPETRYLCEDAGVRSLLVSAPLAESIAPLADIARVRPVEPLLAGHVGRATQPRPASSVDDSSAALQMYTSGTTGRPKGAVLTHANVSVQLKQVGEAWGFRPSDVLLHALPLHHVHGLGIALLTALGAGAAARMRAFDATKIWDEMADATVFMGVPAMYHRLFAAYDAAGEAERARWQENAKALRLATSGSAALPVGLAERWKSLTGTIPLERYGMTEIGVGITNSLAGPRFAGCVGLPLPTVEARIVGDDGTSAETGELWIRGPSVFVGYHERDVETQKAFVVDEGGAWFKTGDTVTRDEALPGRPYRILGRTSVDILKSGGYKLSALEIEEVLRLHAAVGEVAVVGLPDEAWGDRVVACVVLRPTHACDATELRAFVRERMATYKVPKDVVFFTEFPKTALGKVQKSELARSLQR